MCLISMCIWIMGLFIMSANSIDIPTACWVISWILLGLSAVTAVGKDE